MREKVIDEEIIAYLHGPYLSTDFEEETEATKELILKNIRKNKAILDDIADGYADGAVVGMEFSSYELESRIKDGWFPMDEEDQISDDEDEEYEYDEITIYHYLDIRFGCEEALRMAMESEEVTLVDVDVKAKDEEEEEKYETVISYLETYVINKTVEFLEKEYRVSVYFPGDIVAMDGWFETVTGEELLVKRVKLWR